MEWIVKLCKPFNGKMVNGKKAFQTDFEFESKKLSFKCFWSKKKRL
jgi:hypothetical protein